jgi:hypothetical protein
MEARQPCGRWPNLISQFGPPDWTKLAQFLLDFVERKHTDLICPIGRRDPTRPVRERGWPDNVTFVIVGGLTLDCFSRAANSADPHHVTGHKFPCKLSSATVQNFSLCGHKAKCYQHLGPCGYRFTCFIESWVSI